MKKALACVCSFLLALWFSGNLAYAEDPEGTAEPEHKAGAFVIRQVEEQELPPSIRGAIAFGEKRETLPFVNAARVEAIINEVLFQLEAEGIDTRQLFDGKTIPVYLTNASFGDTDTNVFGYTVWYGKNHDSNAIVMAGKFRSDMSHLKSVAHEIGHLVYFHYFDQEAMEAYKKARNIPDTWNDDLEWTQRPMEVFAEDFAVLFGHKTFVNSTEKHVFPEWERREVKTLIVDQIKAAQKEIQFEHEAERVLYELKLLGVIPRREFALHEIETYERQPATNQEFVDWMIRVLKRDHAITSFEDIRKMEKLYQRIEPLYTEKTAGKEDILSILDGFSDFLDGPWMRTWDVIDFMNSDVDIITKGQAALIVYNFIHD